MAVTKPYYRIFRPSLKNAALYNPVEGYECDALFLPEAEKKSMLMTAQLIIDDLERLFEYVEPNTSNENVFSHRIYELFLRTCTEVESCCKGILLANGQAANNMDDYKKIEQATHLSAYTVRYSNWLPSQYTTQPYASWATGGSLPWYKAYNDVKHNRSQKFYLASLKNLLDSISGLLCIIHSQIGNSVQRVYRSNIYLSPENDDKVLVRSFTIIPSHFSDNEKYDFDWNRLKNDASRFQSYQFK